MACVLITGGTGLVGSVLTPMLQAKGYEVIILTRNPKPSAVAGLSYAAWDVEKQTVDTSAISKADFVIHLAGESVAGKRWSKARKQQIVDSRVKSSALLVKALNENTNKVKTVVSASAVGWYGADNISTVTKPFTEEAPAANGFLGETCKLWEESIEPVLLLKKRLVKIRIGIVLSNDGGALAEFKKPVRLGIAAVLGSGKQIISWIHIEDLCRCFVYAIEHEELQGVYNGVAPKPVTNKELTLKLAQKTKGRFFVPLHMPGFVLRIALGEMSTEVLKSATVSDQKIRDTGFQFLYPSIESALEALCAK